MIIQDNEDQWRWVKIIQRISLQFALLCVKNISCAQSLGFHGSWTGHLLHPLAITACRMFYLRSPVWFLYTQVFFFSVEKIWCEPSSDSNILHPMSLFCLLCLFGIFFVLCFLSFLSFSPFFLPFTVSCMCMWQYQCVVLHQVCSSRRQNDGRTDRQTDGQTNIVSKGVLSVFTLTPSWRWRWLRTILTSANMFHKINTPFSHFFCLRVGWISAEHPD